MLVVSYVKGLIYVGMGPTEAHSAKDESSGSATSSGYDMYFYTLKDWQGRQGVTRAAARMNECT